MNRATGTDGTFQPRADGGFAWPTSKIDRSLPIAPETEQIPNRRNSPLNSRAQIL